MFSKSASKELKEESSAVKQMTQKEYLKKYLSNDSSKKKKKKKIKIAPSTIQRSQIIDDDIDLKKMRLLGENELDLNQLDEDAPQIAGIIDERPPELQTIESYRNSGRWKAISDETTGEIGISDKHAEAEERKKLTSINNKALARRFITHNIEKPSSRSLDTHSRNSSKKQKKVSDSDLSPSRPPRKSKAGNDSDVSPLRPSRKLDSGNDSDLSPARPSKKLKSGYESDQSPPRQSRKHKSGYDSDISPPRPSRKQKSGNDSDLSPVRPSRKHKSGNDSDLSPPRPSRKHKSGNDSDLSPPRPSRKYKSGNDSDLSPPRPSRKHKSGNDSDSSPPRPSRKHKSGNDSDLSPPRPSRKHKSGNDSDLSPPRPSRKHRSGNDSDLSPPRPSRKHKSGNDSDLSPPRPSRNHKSGNDSDLSPPRPSRKYKSESNADFSPPRPSRKYENNRENYRGRREENSNFRDSKTFSKRDRDFHDSRSLNSRSSRENNRERKSRFDDRSPDNSSRSDEKKMTETLSGKKAGLQDARALKQENMKIKEKEDIAFKQMSASVSGEGAGAVVRDRRTGRIRDPEREKEFKKRKEAKQAIDNEKYEKWGKGLKQVEDYKEKLENDLYEMAKPLARYADDDDLDEFLKSQDREGDPMLEYLREKKVKTSGPSKEKPTYKGPYPPNRFNIRPGYRWDGVDRSSGYEKQWFSKQNERKAVSEEAYKWSTADM